MVQWFKKIIKTSLKSLQCTKEEFNCGEIHIELPSQTSQISSLFKYAHTAVQSPHHLQSSYLTKLSLYSGNSSSSSSPPWPWHPPSISFYESNSPNIQHLPRVTEASLVAQWERICL